MLRSGTVRNTMLHENVFTNRAADFTNMINRPLDVVQLRLKAVGGGDVLRLDRLDLVLLHPDLLVLTCPHARRPGIGDTHARPGTAACK